MVEVAPPAERMPRSMITHSGRLVARMAARSPFWNPRLSRPQATARTRSAVWLQVREYHLPSRRPDMASASGVSATRYWNMWTTERNVGSLMAQLPSKAWISLNDRMIAGERSLQLEQRIAHLDRLAGLDENLADRAAVLGEDLVLHLHGFEHHDTLARRDLLPFLGEQGDDAAWHVGGDPLPPLAGLAAARLGGEVGERIGDLDGA